MQALALLVVIVGSSMAAPAKLDGLEHHQHHHHPHPNDPLASLASGTKLAGYDYPTPKVPSGLYGLPTNNVQVTPTTTTTTTTTTTPASSYLPPGPDHHPMENVPVPVIVGTTMMPMPYDFNWAVQDPDSGNSFSHVENSNGKDVTGEYSVLLPDNRLQIVRFKSDPVNGYQAQVFYEPAK